MALLWSKDYAYAPFVKIKVNFTEWETFEKLNWLSKPFPYDWFEVYKAKVVYAIIYDAIIQQRKKQYI